MLESQNPGFRVLNLKTRVPKSMRKPGFSGFGSNPGSIPTYTYIKKLPKKIEIDENGCSKDLSFQKIVMLVAEHGYRGLFGILSEPFESVH